MTNGDQTSAGGVPRQHIFHEALQSVEHALANSGIYELVDQFDTSRSVRGAIRNSTSFRI